ncbi:MAG: hypothetical protein ACKO8I_18605 [Cyanobacteriota bacterium]
MRLLDALEDSGNTLVVSAASAWELATKWRLGKLPHARADELVLASTARGSPSLKGW